MPKNQTRTDIPEDSSTTVDTAATTVEPQNSLEAQHKKVNLSRFANPEYNAPISNICICQVINHMDKDKVGLFIKDKHLPIIDWKGANPTHVHTFSTGTPETGILLQSPRMHILDISPRYIEQREDGTIIGIYEFGDGYDMYQNMGKDKVVLRSFYLIKLVDENNCELHSRPLVISIKGVAAAQFGEAYKQFKQELEVAFARFQDVSVAEKTREFHRLGVFQPTFVPSHEPKEAVNQRDKSWVAVVSSYKSPNPDGSDFMEFFCDDKEEEFETLMQANLEFSHRIGKTSDVIAEHMRLVGMNEAITTLPPGNYPSLPSHMENAHY
jgi:Family of unknown function (DUF5895)